MNKNILIVRSDKEGAKALSFLLSGTGYRTSSHSTAKSALEAARQEHYDLAIADRSIPENRLDLGFISNLKEAQPKLPIFLLSEKHELDDIINCIRVGITDIIEDPKDLKRIFEATNNFFNHENSLEDDVTWEDMLEVEQTLSALFKKKEADGSDSEAAKAKRLDEELKKALDRIANLEHSNKALQTSKAKSDTLLAEIKKSGSGVDVNSADYVERQSLLKEQETRLKERESKIAKQKAEAEILLADLESRQFELEEENGHAPTGEGAAEVQRKLDAFQLDWNANRLDLEAQITDLNRELAQAKVSSSKSKRHEEELRAINESLRDSNEAIAEKDFILGQRTKEIEKLKTKLEVGQVAIQTIEDLDEEKRLLEIERFKLQEKTDKYEEDQLAFDNEFEKRQREIEVNKRDAEVTLRELQNRIKEKQLTLKVDQASFKDEARQFDQAKRNFQEDIEDLQSKQSELKQFEDQLKQMKNDMEDGNRSLPSHPERAPAQESPPEPKVGSKKEEPAQPIPTVARHGNTPPEEPKWSDDKNEPKTWNRPPKNRRGSNRGPLRIGGNLSDS